MNLEDYQKYMMQKNSPPVAPRQPANPNAGHGNLSSLGADMGPKLNQKLKMEMLKAMYKNGGPTRPMEQTNAMTPSVPGAAQQQSPTTVPTPRPPMKDQQRSPAMDVEKGGRVYEEKKPDHWKNFRSQLAEQFLTPGYHDKERGIWVNSYQAAYENRKRRKKSDKAAEVSRKMLTENGVNGATADWASKQDPEIQQRIIAAQVKTPTKFDEERQKDAAEWASTRPEVMNDLNSLRESLNYLEGQSSDPDWLNKDGFLNQFIKSSSGDYLLSLTEGGRALKTNRDLVQGVAAKNLKLILGGQFAQKEGEQLLARAYDKNMPPEENARRVRRLIASMEYAAAAKDKLYSEVKDPSIREREMKHIEQKVLELNEANSSSKESVTSTGVKWKLK